MGIKNHNTKREKTVMRKRLRIAVFIAVSLGIVLIVFRYFGFVSKTIYEESVSHLTEVFHQSDNMLRELTEKNLTYLHMWGENLQNTSSEDEIRDYMNRYLPDDIAVKEVKEASERFHARYKAVGKLYRYTCYDGPVKPVFQRKYVTVLEKRPDLEKMQQAAAYLEGKHDYKSFCGNPRMKKSTVRVVDKIEITRKGSFIYFDFHGTGFLQNMVRILVGTLLEVGKGKIKPEQIPDILEAKNRQMAGPTAPPQGLCLIKVDY